MSNQELMQVGGLLRTPPQVNYSLTLPAGSPDYTAASAEYTWRYATFVFAAMACMSSFSILLQDIQGTNWGDYQTTGSGRADLHQIRRACSRHPDGWTATNSTMECTLLREAVCC